MAEKSAYTSNGTAMSPFPETAVTEKRGVFGQPEGETADLAALLRSLGVDISGIADLHRLAAVSGERTTDPADLLGRFHYAAVMGCQLRKLSRQASGAEADLFLEKAALETAAYLEGKGFPAFIAHPEDEFDPLRRMGLLPVKVLAKQAGLGWQGRSLLIVSSEFGPIHRWIAVLTNLELVPGDPLPNQCGECRECIDKCPGGALRFAPFTDHPERREDVLDITACKGDDGCSVCLVVCPWAKQHIGSAG
jgi:epoxyqueuosine reductase